MEFKSFFSKIRLLCFFVTILFLFFVKNISFYHNSLIDWKYVIVGWFIILYFVAFIRDFIRAKALSNVDGEKTKEYIRLGMPIAKRNSGLSGVLKTSEVLLDVADEEILMQAGNLDYKYYENKEICKILNGFLKNKKGKLRIICSPREECNSQTETIFRFQQNPGYNIEIAHATERPEAHFMVVDDKHYRLEKKHSPEEHYEADIMYNNPYFANFHRKLFIKKWKEVTESDVL